VISYYPWTLRGSLRDEFEGLGKVSANASQNGNAWTYNNGGCGRVCGPKDFRVTSDVDSVIALSHGLYRG
jgi:hypothetical protein